MPDLMSHGRLLSDTGQLYVVPRPSTGIPNAVQRNQGWLIAGAIDSFGYQFIEDAGSAVPSTATFADGFAYTPDGALYVTDSAPAASASYKEGFAIRADGALHVNSGTPSGGLLKEGMRASSGRLSIASDIYKNANLAAWYRQNVGQTVTGSGVSSWADQSGNGRDLTQGTDTNRPALQSDGSVLFDGVDNYMDSPSFALSQPIFLYLLFRNVTHTNSDTIFNGQGATFVVQQGGVSGRVTINAGGSNVVNDALALNTYGVFAGGFNGASSVNQINSTSVTGDAGTNGFTSGIRVAGNGPPNVFSHIQVKEIILFAAAHSAAVRERIVSYLINVNGGSV